LITIIFSCQTGIRDKHIDSTIKQKIKIAFDDWTKDEIRKGNFFAQDSCNVDYYVMKDSLGLESVFGLSVPWDSSEINFYYSDLNKDNREDALITFTPYQCDGGNATMWIQYQLLVFSQGDYYSLTDNYFEKYKADPGFFHLDSAVINAVFGTYYEFKENDCRCCPSIQRPIKIDIEKNEFKYLDK